MQTLDTDGPVQPVLIHDRNGQAVFSALTNTKGYNKSLENGVLWALDGSTGRLVPLTDLVDGGGPRISAALKAAGRAAGARWVTGLDRREGAVLVRTDLEFGQASGATVEATAPKAGAVPAASADPEGRDLAAFLLELQDLIRTRKATMPEGSYTTHLFKAGLGKIRKKTGEEAIELLLAQTVDETVSEASDLVYHLMVLLVALDIPVERVLAELKRR